MCGICEYWMPIKGYEGLYQISNFGNIKSLKRNKIIKICVKKINNKNRVYKYYHVALSDKYNNRKNYTLSRLVWSAFNDEIPAGFEIDHIDNDPANNCLFNLQLLTHSENIKKTYKDNPEYINTGGVQRKKIKCIQTGIEYESIRDCCRKMNINRGNLNSHLRCKRYKSIQGYHFVCLDNLTNKKTQVIK